MTVLERMVEAGISVERAIEHVLAGRVWVDGVVVDDRHRPVERAERVTLREP